MKWIRLWMITAVVFCVAVFWAARPLTHPLTSRSSAELSIRVVLSERKLYEIENGEVTRAYSVAVGSPKYPTPTGEFHVRRIIWNPRWVPPDAAWAADKHSKEPGDPDNPMGKVKIFFSEPDYYIHATHEVDSLGEAESHGCIRMRTNEAIDLARRIMKAGGAPMKPGFVRRTLNRIRSTHEVRLSEPVLVVIRD